MEKNKNPDEVTIEIGSDGDEAFATLVAWVKTVPKVLEDIKANGTEEDLKNYQLQIKMVLEKLKVIKQEIRND